MARSSAEVVFFYFPLVHSDRLMPASIECVVHGFQSRVRCYLVIETAMRGGERQNAKLNFDEAAPQWIRKGLTTRIWSRGLPLGAAVIHEVARGAETGLSDGASLS